MVPWRKDSEGPIRAANRDATAKVEAAGLRVRERLVLFTALGRAVPVQACYPVS
jgi:hypothetical protein